MLPDNAKLQPIPVHVYPNISGNANAKVGSGYQNSGAASEVVAKSAIEETSSTNVDNQKNSSTSSGIFWPIFYLAIAFLIATVLIIFY